MKKDIVQYKLYGFRLTKEEITPTIVVAPDFADALSIWFRSHDGEEPHDITCLGFAYVQIEMPF